MNLKMKLGSKNPPELRSQRSLCSVAFKREIVGMCFGIITVNKLP